MKNRKKWRDLNCYLRAFIIWFIVSVILVLVQVITGFSLPYLVVAIPYFTFLFLGLYIFL